MSIANEPKFFYSVGPIDHFDGCMTIDEFKAAADKSDSEREPDGYSMLENIIEVERIAKREFVEIGWEGDIRQGPYIFSIPDPGCCSMHWGIVLKHDSNGQTFIASPVELPWLNGDADEVRRLA
jgi:hypothetical protein